MFTNRTPQHKMLQDSIQNHVALVVDDSGSMKSQPVVSVFDAQLNRLKQKSIDLGQETRISIYLFGSTVRCLAFDMDVMRFKSLKGFWAPDGMTALRDGVGLAIQDHKTLPQQYGNHHFLLYVITDGGENHSYNYTATSLKNTINGLAENWSVACMVPDSSCKSQAEACGIAANDIAIWNTSDADAMLKVGDTFTSVIDNFMTMRSTGQKIVRGSGSLFKLDPSKLSKTAVRRQLDEVNPNEFDILHVRTRDPKGVPIKEFVESWQKSYRPGSAYYQPTKKVKIQGYKGIMIQDAKNGRVYEGEQIRGMLGLPDFTVDVDPADHRDWRIFVQSTSVNRKLFNDTMLLVRK